MKLVFSKKVIELLNNMGINEVIFSSDLVREFGANSSIFNKLLEEYAVINVMPNLNIVEFSKFMKENGFSDPNSTLYNKAFDLFHYIDLFLGGGIITLFKFREAAWKGPKILITKNNAPASDISILPNQMTAYRGLSLTEYENSCFCQSWTLDINVAKRFAFNTYSDEPRGIVAEAMIRKSEVLYHKKTDHESEIIIQKGSVTSATKILT